MIIKRKIQFNHVYSTSVTIIFMLLLLANSIEAQHRVGIARLNAQSSWYTCSARNTDYIAYNLTVISDDVKPTINFGNSAPGWPLQYQGPPGVIVVTTNSTEMLDFLNPHGQIAWYYANYSCIDEPVTSCTKATTDKRLSNNTVQCLAVTNPNNNSITCELNISFNALPDPDSDTTNDSYNINIATTNIPIIQLIYFTNILCWTFIYFHVT